MTPNILNLPSCPVSKVFETERDYHIYISVSDNKGNGYYARDLRTGSRKLQVNVLMDLEGEFRPCVLPEA